MHCREQFFLLDSHRLWFTEPGSVINVSLECPLYAFIDLDIDSDVSLTNDKHKCTFTVTYCTNQSMLTLKAATAEAAASWIDAIQGRSTENIKSEFVEMQRAQTTIEENSVSACKAQFAALHETNTFLGMLQNR